jgi:hypothetical protein
MFKKDDHLLDTTAKIIKFIDGLSYFIDVVKITEVYPGGFSFKVRVPFWYKILFGWHLRRTIQREMKSRMIIGVDFKFVIYSTEFF